LGRRHPFTEILAARGDAHRYTEGERWNLN